MHFKNEELNPEFDATLYKFPNELKKLIMQLFQRNGRSEG